MIRKTVENLMAYDPKEPEGGIKLDANENTYPVLEELKVHMSKWIGEVDINRYPDTNSNKLREAIAKKYLVDREQVICTVGSDELIENLFYTFVEKQEAVLVPDPSFVMYSHVGKVCEARLIKVSLGREFEYDVEAYIEAIEEYQPKMVFICNPNNPTGSMLSQDGIKRIAEYTKGLIVVDEAYIEFGGQSAINLIKEYPNLIVLRTFSKAYGLAGARVGYGIGSKEVVGAIYRVKPPYNLNRFSQEIATWVITNTNLYQSTIDEIVESREQMSRRLTELGCKVYPSQTNFLWVETEEALRAVLIEEGIYIREMMYDGKAYYRISVGTKQENETLIGALERRRGL